MSEAERRLGHVISGTGVYNRHLVPLQRLAIEFSQERFGKWCRVCDYLQLKRKEYQRWLDSWHKRSPGDYTDCLLCTALERPELADLSAAQRKEARKWIKINEARPHLHWSKPNQEVPAFEPDASQETISRLLDQGYHKAYPMLRRVHDAM
jgi:hypothetical protein